MVTEKMREYRRELEKTNCWNSRYKKLSEFELKEKANIAILFSYIKNEFRDFNPSYEHDKGEFCWHEMHYFYSVICRIYRYESKQREFLSTNPFKSEFKKSQEEDEWFTSDDYDYHDIITEITKKILEVVYNGENKTEINDYLFDSDEITIIKCNNLDLFNIPKEKRKEANRERIKHFELGNLINVNSIFIPRLAY